jgi:Polyphosphate kinase 2 (PPK2)
MKEDGDDPVDMEDIDVTPSKLKRKTHERELATLQARAGEAAALDQARRPAGGPAPRGPRRRRQGRDIKRIVEPLNPPGATIARSARRVTGKRRSGTSSATSRTCQPRVRSSCSTAPGTTAPASSGSWASAPTRSPGSSCTPAPSSSACSSATGSSCASTGSRSATRSRSGASRSARPTPSGAGSSARRTSSRDMWVAYSRAKDEMFRYTHTPEAPWYTVESDDKRRAPQLHLVHPRHDRVQGRAAGSDRVTASPEARGRHASAARSTHRDHREVLILWCSRPRLPSRSDGQHRAWRRLRSSRCFRQRAVRDVKRILPGTLAVTMDAGVSRDSSQALASDDLRARRPTARGLLLRPGGAVVRGGRAGRSWWSSLPSVSQCAGRTPPIGRKRSPALALRRLLAELTNGASSCAPARSD